MSNEIKKPGIVLPVIHLQSEAQAVSMAEIAQDEGATGVFLIDHKEGTAADPEVLAEATVEVITKFPELWVGVNCLGLRALESLEYFGGGLGVDGVWTDNALNWQGHRHLSINHQNVDEAGAALSRVDKGQAIHFGGLSMKGGGYIVEDWAATRFIAFSQGHVDVVTTSGPGTGIPMDPARAAQIKKAMIKVESPTKPLAIASGVDASNIKNYVGKEKPVQHVLVGSSIETGHLSGIFNRRKLRDLMKTALDLDIELASS